MDLALHFPCVYPLVKQRFRRANHLPFRDSPSSGFGQSFSTGRSKKESVCCTKPSDEGSSSPSETRQEEIISLFRRIQASISNGESRGAEEKNLDGSSERGPLSKAILDVLDKPRNKIEGDTGVKTEPPKGQGNLARRPPSSFAKRSPIRPSDSDPRGKLSVTKSDKAEETEKEEKPPLILETMKLAELKEVAKNSGLKGYSRLKKSEILELLRSSR